MIDLAITRIPAKVFEGSVKIEPTNPLLTDLIAYYRFDGSGEDTVNGHDLTVNAGTLGAGKINGSMLAGYATREGLSIATSGDVTISAWINIGVDVGEIAGSAAVSILNVAGDRYISLLQNSRDAGDTQSAIQVFNGTTTQEVFFNTVGQMVSDTQWLHVVALLKSDGIMLLFVNGNSNDDDYSLIPFTIGTISILSDIDYQSRVGDVGIWNRALSEDEIQQLYNSGNGLDPTA